MKLLGNLISSVSAQLTDTGCVGFTVLLTLFISGLAKQGKHGRKLRFSDRWQAWWFLLNASLIHLFLDGFVGLFQQIPALADEYDVLDKRYRAQNALVQLVSLFEVLVMSPMCYALYYGIHQHKSWRHPLQILLCAIHFMGTYFFTLTEIADGFPNIPADLEMRFDPHSLFYFWLFFVAANILWTALPLYLAVQSFRRCTNAIERAKQH